jgi:dTDP-4-dehydrorhamnose 3,5-epimerase
MKIADAGLPGAKLIEIELIEDHRGFFGRSFCQREFEAAGLEPCVAQCNISYNKRKGTLRGMHLQKAPHEEAKLVRCTRGSLYDVIVDLRPRSATHMKWFGVELSADNRKALYVPAGFAHGFQTLTDDVEVFYQMSTFFVPGAGFGVRWNDPRFAIRWPLTDPILSASDSSYADYTPA